MNKSVITTGKTIEEAIEKAVAELGVSRENVQIEVLERPKSGFLGIGSAPAKVQVSYETSRADKAAAFLEGLLKRMNSNATPVIEVGEEGLLDIHLEGDNLGMLIGRRGETLNAIQHITNYVVNHGEEERVRVVVDIENYRQKREESLQKLAEKTAAKVMKYRRNIALEPMNAYERHVIHAALQSYKDVSTFSSGAEPRRCVVISYTPNGERPAPKQSQGSNRQPRSFNGRGNREGSRPPREHRETPTQQVAQKRKSLEVREFGVSHSDEE